MFFLLHSLKSHYLMLVSAQVGLMLVFKPGSFKPSYYCLNLESKFFISIIW